MTATQQAPAAPAAEPAAEVLHQDIRTAKVLRSGGVSLAMLGALLIGFLVYLMVASDLQHARDQTTMYANLRYQLAQGTAPVGPTAEGTALAVLEIPRLDLREVVVEGTTSTDLVRGPGHRRDTPLPGQPGVSVIYGRNGLYGAPFGSLSALHSGDTISVTTGQGVARYVVSGRNGPIPMPGPSQSVLVLVSADSSRLPRQEVVVHATLTSQVVPGNAKLPVVTRPEVGLSGDPAAVVPLTLWAQALLLVAAATTWAYVRWSRWPTYVISTPVLFAVLWNIYENVARLLPNTL